MKTAIAALIMTMNIPAFAAPSYAAFEKACSQALTGHKNARAVCDCMVRNFKIKTLDENQVRLITERYQGKDHNEFNEQVSVLFDFEEDVAELCLKNPKAKIQP